MYLPFHAGQLSNILDSSMNSGNSSRYPCQTPLVPLAQVRKRLLSEFYSAFFYFVTGIEMNLAVVGIINHFIFKALIFWEKVKVSLVFEN